MFDVLRFLGRTGAEDRQQDGVCQLHRQLSFRSYLHACILSFLNLTNGPNVCFTLRQACNLLKYSVTILKAMSMYLSTKNFHKYLPVEGASWSRHIVIFYKQQTFLKENPHPQPTWPTETNISLENKNKTGTITNQPKTSGMCIVFETRLYTFFHKRNTISILLCGIDGTGRHLLLLHFREHKRRALILTRCTVSEGEEWTETEHGNTTCWPPETLILLKTEGLKSNKSIKIGGRVTLTASPHPKKLQNTSWASNLAARKTQREFICNMIQKWFSTSAESGWS